MIQYRLVNNKEKMKKQNIIIISMITFSILAFSIPAVAANNTVKQATKEAVQTIRCDGLSAKIDKHINRLTAELNKRIVLYEKHDSKIKILIDKSKTLGIDTAKAEADWQIWQQKTISLKTARTQVIIDLQSAKAKECPTQIDNYRVGLTTVKVQMAAIRKLQQDKKTFFSSTLKPDLQSISDQLKAQKNNNN